MAEKMTPEKIEMVYLTCVIKDIIHVKAYENNPAYKWLDETWSVMDIMEAIHSNNIKSKEEGIEYLLSIAHLLGKDKRIPL